MYAMAGISKGHDEVHNETAATESVACAPGPLSHSKHLADVGVSAWTGDVDGHAPIIWVNKAAVQCDLPERGERRGTTKMWA